MNGKARSVKILFDQKRSIANQKTPEDLRVN